MSYQTKFQSEALAQEMHSPDAAGIFAPIRLDRREHRSEEGRNGLGQLMDMLGMRFIG